MVDGRNRTDRNLGILILVAAAVAAIFLLPGFLGDGRGIIEITRNIFQIQPDSRVGLGQSFGPGTGDANFTFTFFASPGTWICFGPTNSFNVTIDGTTFELFDSDLTDLGSSQKLWSDPVLVGTVGLTHSIRLEASFIPSDADVALFHEFDGQDTVVVLQGC